MGAKKKTINRKHINIYLAALAGQSSQGRTPTRPRDKRDKMAIFYCGIFFVKKKPVCLRDWSQFVPPKMFMFIGFFLPDQCPNTIKKNSTEGKHLAQWVGRVDNCHQCSDILRRKTNVQQLTCKMVFFFFHFILFYSLFVSLI